MRKFRAQAHQYYEPTEYLQIDSAQLDSIFVIDAVCIQKKEMMDMT